MALHRRPDERFDANLRVLTRAGIEAPPEIAQLRERLECFRSTAFDKTVLNKVVDGIISGTDDDVSVLWAAACAEFFTADPGKNELLQTVRERVNAACRRAYEAVALKNYETIAARFNTAAEGFAAAADVIHPNTSSDEVVGASDKVRKAWVAQSVHAAELDQHLRVLRAAAELAGLCGIKPDDIIDLVVEPAGATRERVIHAWETDERETAQAKAHNNGLPFTTAPPTVTRCGRWTALHAIGCAIRAREAQPVTA